MFYFYYISTLDLLVLIRYYCTRASNSVNPRQKTALTKGGSNVRNGIGNTDPQKNEECDDGPGKDNFYKSIRDIFIPHGQK